MADLIDQSTTPFPWLFSHFRALKLAHQKDQTSPGNAVHTETERRSDLRSRSLLRLHSANLQKDVSQSQCEENTNGNASGAVFTETQSLHEQKIFQTYMLSPKITTVRGAPRSRFLDNMKGEIDSDDLIKPGERRAKGVWLRKQVGPRQRTRRPHVSVKSKLSGSTVTTKWDSAVYNENSLEYTGAYVLPIVTVEIVTSTSTEFNCSDHAKLVNVMVTLVNQRKFRMWVQIYNWIDREQSQEATVGPQEVARMYLEGLKWNRETFGQLRWLQDTCERLIQLGVNVQYETPAESKNDDKVAQICGRVWRVCLFGRHAYSCKDDVLRCN